MINKPLSKGLAALIPKKISRTPDQPSKQSEAIFYIDITRIQPNPYQPRKEFNLELIKSLAESISHYGILQPLVVSKSDRVEGNIQTAEYQLIAGERRLTAAKMAGLKEVPVIIRQTSPQEKLELSIIENVQRADLNPIEKALAYKRLEKEFNLSQKEIANICGKSREAVANTMRLLSLSENVQQSLREGTISEGHARTILAAHEAKQQEYIFGKILSNGLSVREAEELVQKMNVQKTGTKVKKISPEFIEMEEKIKEYLQISKVKVRNEMGKPKIVLTFNSKSEVENFIKRFSV
ncbi:MAG TPA: ParB/RepB/Spo0J family partition protein [Candidatus Pacearchaeota archaeon]|nr:ParB/RepB/Spo0J family partition protein [Candidatus Pacearchaeota archaeon]